MKNEIFVENEYIETYKINKDNIKILVISDIHYHEHTNKMLYDTLYNYIIKSLPNYIVIPGDIIDTYKVLNNIESKKFLNYFFKSISEISKVIIVPGNHDIVNFNIKNYLNNDYQNNYLSMNYLYNLNKINNIYFLNNEQVKLDDIVFTGLNLRHETYLKYKDKYTNDLFIKDYINNNFKIDNNLYNILLCHNPMPLFDEYILNSLEDINYYDLSICGHFHDGFIPKLFDKYIKNTNIGIFTMPFILPYPGIECRGLHKVGDRYIFISQGFKKFGNDNILYNILDKFSSHDIEELNIRKKILK